MQWFYGWQLHRRKVSPKKQRDFWVPRIFRNEEDEVPWFYGYTRVTRGFLGHLYFRHTYKRPPYPTRPVQYPRGVGPSCYLEIVLADA